VRNYKTDHRNPRRLRYGWKLTQSGHITIDAAQRACVYRILALRRDGRTLQQICDRLVADGWPAPRRGKWYCATVKKIVEQNAALYALLPRLATQDPASSPSAALARAACEGARDEAMHHRIYEALDV